MENRSLKATPRTKPALRVGGFPHIHNDKGCRLAKVKTTPNESKEQLAQTETRQAGLAIGRAADKVDGLDLDLESMALC